MGSYSDRQHNLKKIGNIIIRNLYRTTLDLAENVNSAIEASLLSKGMVFSLTLYREL